MNEMRRAMWWLGFAVCGLLRNHEGYEIRVIARPARRAKEKR